MQASFLINSYVPAYIDYYKFTGAKIMSLFQKYGSIVNVPWGEGKRCGFNGWGGVFLPDFPIP